MTEEFDFFHLTYSLSAAASCCENDVDLCEVVANIGLAIERAKLAFTTGLKSGTAEKYDLWLTSLCYIWSFSAPLAKLAVTRVVCQELQPAKHIIKLLLHFIAHNPSEACPVLLKQGKWFLV